MKYPSLWCRGGGLAGGFGARVRAALRVGETPNLETLSPSHPHIRNRTPLETRDHKPKLEIRDPKPEVPNPEPQALK